MPRKPPHLSPQPDSQDVLGFSHTTTILMHYRRIQSYASCQYVLEYLLIVDKIHVNDYAEYALFRLQTWLAFHFEILFTELDQIMKNDKT